MSATMTEEIVLDEALLEQHLPCNTPSGCDRPAMWVARCSGPDRHPWTLCDEHHREAMEQYRKHQALNRIAEALLRARAAIVCLRCGAVWPHPVPWGRL